ncbi:HlyC/CorC family transporter [Candidatus Peregrinibacteria bacterium]|jgi:CBS domain containing-hemolysin-like protein|nr:HlyC/CorC family transporter [Candidatus Peregrinibacteria bacterium]
MIELVIIITVILFFSGFFSGAEAALVSITDAEVHAMLHRKVVGSSVLVRVHKNLNRSVIAIVVWNNVVNIVGSIMVGQMVITLYGDAILAVITTALTFGIILFSEIIPKAIGIHYAERIALITAPVILMLTTIMLPIIVALEYITNLFKKGERKVGTEAQIRSLVTIGRKLGHIESDEGQLIHRAFILNDKTADDIMTPLKDIIAVNTDDTIGEAWQKIDHEPHSRYPVFGISMHEVKGMIIKQDVLQSLYEKNGGDDIESIIRDVLTVKSDMRSDELIALFREKNIHQAVVQENDHTVGLVTLEDVLEELVGEIEDETDVED